jgi:antitoxin (DNA-binding transcriptional repressor) of toxin-antitoxin stability system
MIEMTVGELKTHFSSVLSDVQRGEHYRILFGRSKKPVAELVPAAHTSDAPRTLGVLKGKIHYEMDDDFKFDSVEEFLGQ